MDSKVKLILIVEIIDKHCFTWAMQFMISVSTYVKRSGACLYNNLFWLFPNRTLIHAYDLHIIVMFFM